MGELTAQAGKLKNVKTPETVRSHYITLSPSDPLTSACRFISEHCTQEGLKTLHYHRGGFFTYTGTHYREADNQAIRTRLYKFLKQARRLNNDGAYVPFEPDQRKVSNVIDALKAEVFLNSEADLPVWLKNSNIPADEILACKNCLLHLPTLESFNHTPAYLGCESLPFEYDPQFPIPKKWIVFLNQLWPRDPASIRALQEWFGYFLSLDTRQQKILLIVGPRRSGKGTIGRILGKLLGSRNVCAPSFFSLTQNFGLAPLIGKCLAIISDARIGARTDQAAAAEKLLSISGEDSLTIDRKHRTAWTGTLPTRILVLSNELPRILDSSGALASRLFVLKLTESFLGRENTKLTDHLSTELPGILNWALYGLIRFQKRGHFVQPESSKELIRQLEDLGSPISEFIRDKCTLGLGFSIPTDQLFRAWKQWCESQGIQPGSMSVFGRSLSSYAPSVEKKRPRKAGRKSHYMGIKLA